MAVTATTAVVAAMAAKETPAGDGDDGPTDCRPTPHRLPTAVAMLTKNS
jgi:hypothetical protein